MPTPKHRSGRRGASLTTTAAFVATAALLVPSTSAQAEPAPSGIGTTVATAAEHGAPDEIAADYYEALLRHTRWVETVWDEGAGVYQAKDMNFAVVLGNAVLLTHGEYDAELAGVSEDVLREQTIATITRYAATNRFVDPAGTWGKQLFWDSTFQSYFLDAGRLMWDELDATTRENLTTIATGQSRYTADLDFGKDPMSGSWTADWPTGKHVGDTAQEEAGVYTQALAPGLAWAPDDPDAGRWADQLDDWARNAAGQPTADANNPAVVGGKPVSSNTMQTIYDTYLVENHGSFGPHYQSDIWRSGGRNAIQFVLNDQPVPEILTHQPNSAELWESIKLVMSDQGEPFMPMVNDREFLYGRDVLPMAYLGQVLREPDAVRAEAGLAAALEDYQNYAPQYRLTKFSGEPKYEPEARAEIAISYLLHVEAAESAQGPVEPTPDDEFFAGLAGVRDFGEGPGLTVQQSETAWAAASSKKGFVKFPWVPGHDSWLFHVSGSTPYLYPSTGATVAERNVSTYTTPRDGFEGTSSMFRIGDGYAGQVTLPTGSALYASSGAGPDDASLSVRNLDMDGYSGLDGSRTYTTAEGETTATLPVTRPADPADAKAARVDDLSFAPVTARYVRMQGQQGNAQYGYSMHAFHAYADGSDADLAAGRPATASSQDSANGRTAARVTDGNASTRWAVAVSERTRPDSWVQVDLGDETTVSGVRLAWEASAGLRYLVQTSTDGETWTTATAYGKAPADVNVARLDTVDLTPEGADSPAPVTTRYVRMQGVRGNPEYGYSLYHLRAFSPSGTDVAAGRPATASSADGGNPVSAVTDGSASTRWAVSRADRTRADSWVQVDLGSAVDVSQVQLGWESAAGQEYRVQTSLDGETWYDAASFRYTGDEVLRDDDGSWLNVEGEAGFVVRGTSEDHGTVSVSKATEQRHVVRLADGYTGPRLVEMMPGDAAATAEQAVRPVPTADADDVLVSALDGYLTAFNLSGSDVTTTVSVPHEGSDVALYAGTQVVGADTSSVEVTVPAGSAVVLAPRATLSAGHGAPDGVTGGVTATVPDARTVRLSVERGSASVEVRNSETGEARETQVSASGTTVRFPDATPFPVADHALSTLTFPASVLPEGMTSPSLAVDGDPATAWVPGTDGRMVTDLGAPREIGDVVTTWDGPAAPDAVVSVSDDGLTFTDVGTIAGGSAGQAARGSLAVDRTARYVALTTSWADGDPGLAALRVLAPGASDPDLPAPVAVTATAEVRCLAGKPYVAVRVVNDDDAALDIEVATPFGSRTFTHVGPGKNAYQSFAVRAADAPAGAATVTARPSDTTDERETVASPEYDQPTCG
ncbi:discoidin domain-containing protein [Cellulosimicrobium arenosum]|uniref:Discoidin domain-containing protein n=1 Tax=Cellulosimicrobium arenosum TaxID=2708133 RepID=A0A927IZN8_9MICO|nr:discoidin domain-containing protein [Cellulosimicrobium arenosum]MBD8078685.1 discoidin domain-containing protein [Cellulosimicrobium arenosum]